MATKTMKIGLSNSDKVTMKTQVHDAAIEQLITPYSTSATYAVGDYCSKDGKIYKCTTAITTAEAWTSGHWTEKTLNDVIDDVNDAVDSVENKCNPDGYYPTLTSGLADNLNSKVVQNDKDAYIHRTSGGSLEIGSACKEKAIIGGSFGFNQLLPIIATTEDHGITFTNNGDGSYTLNGTATSTAGLNFLRDTGPVFPVGHKILIIGNTGELNCYLQGYSDDTSVSAYTGKDTNIFIAPNPSSSFYTIFRIRVESGTTLTNKKIKPMAIDITAMFGTTIADYIYSLEHAEAGSGVAWFKRYFPKPYYPYTAIGGFTSVKTIGKKVVGFNQFNKNNAISQTYGAVTVEGTNIKIVGTYYAGFGINLIGGNAYYLRYDVVSGNANNMYARLQFSDGTLSDSTYRNGSVFTPSKDVTLLLLYCSSGTSATVIYDKVNINFHYDGERDGEFEEYDSTTYDTDPIDLICIPKIDENGNLYFEGNRYNYDGAVDKTKKIYTFTGNENWEWVENWGGFKTTSITDAKSYDGNSATPDAFLIGYEGKPNFSQSAYRTNMSFVLNSTYHTQNTLGIINTAYGSSDLAAFKTYITGKQIIYTIATPTTDSATAFPLTQKVDNWGTEQYLPPASDTRPAEVPVGHDTDYPLDCKSKIEIAPDLPDTDGTYVCKVESGTASYIALGTWLSSNGYEKPVDKSSGITDSAGLTYTLKKAYKIGNMAFISIVARNSTGSAIAAGSQLVSLSSDLYNSTSGLVFRCDNGGNDVRCAISSAGLLSFGSNIADDTVIYINIAYAVA